MASYTLYAATGGETMTNVVTTRFPQDTIDALDAVAHERRRTRAEIVREAVDVYLARWADYGIALDRLADPSDEVVDADAFWREVETEGE
jgi:predicted DNA-binding protein